MLPPGFFFFERTLGGGTASGLKMSFVDSSQMAIDNLNLLREVHRALGGESSGMALLDKFWSSLEAPLGLKVLGDAPAGASVA